MKSFLLKTIYRLLKSYALRVIKDHDPFIIAVTGSVGKSSTKEAIYKVLSDNLSSAIRSTSGNLNNEIGVPLTILGYDHLPRKILWPIFLFQAWLRSRSIKNYPKYLVLELGVDKPGDMDSLIEIIKPRIAVITSTSAAHLANFPTYHDYQQEKLKLLQALDSSGIGIVNIDDEKLATIRGENIRTVSLEKQEADYRAENINLSLSGSDYRIAGKGHKILVKSKLLGEQMIYPGLFAFVVADYFNIPLLKIGKSLEAIAPLPGRMRMTEGIKGSLIIDDTYNANPTSMKAALDFLSKVSGASRKVAILGTMNELGDAEISAHREIACYAKERVDAIIFVGRLASLVAESFGPGDNVHVFKNRQALEKGIVELIQSGDVILVKASQNGNYLEEVVKKIMKNPKDASSFLVRQSKSWMRKKRK